MQPKEKQQSKEPNDIADRVGFAQWVLERNLHWIAAAEVKVGVVITLDLAMLGGLAAAVDAHGTRWPSVALFSISAVLIVLTALSCAIYSVLPRTGGPKRSLIFFGRIAELGRSDYVDQFSSASLKSLLKDCLEQVHRNAEIACEKHLWVGKAVKITAIGMAPWASAIWILVN